MVVTDTAQQAEILDEAFLGARRGELLAALASSREQVERLSATAVELALDGGWREGGDDEGFGEGDGLGVERDHVLALAGRAQRRMEEIGAALARLETGSYGICATCRQPIASARLEALPETSHCVACKSGSMLQLR